MKKYILITTIVVFASQIKAQRPLDTIYANERKNVALFFPNKLRKGITGSDNFVFTYNREKEQYFGLLKAIPGKESNLLAITNDGQVYNYILKYSDTLKKYNYFIQREESIGNEEPIPVDVPAPDMTEDIIKNRSLYFQRYSNFLLSSQFYPIASKRKNGIVLKLLRVVYNAGQVYLVMKIQNSSGIDFEVDYLSVFKVNGNIRAKASYQKLRQETIFKENMPDLVGNGRSHNFVYILPKFVLNSNEKLLLEVKELNGSRKVVLETDL